MQPPECNHGKIHDFRCPPIRSRQLIRPSLDLRKEQLFGVSSCGLRAKERAIWLVVGLHQRIADSHRSTCPYQ